MSSDGKPRLAVWKFASCDGCQLTLLDCEDELLDVAGAVEIGYFLEASSATADGPYDLSIVEGSITTPADLERIREIRAASKRLVTIGACATSGGIQALRNFSDVKEFLAIVYADPGFISTLDHSTPISAHVAVDFELQGCPIDRGQLLEVISAFLHGRPPAVSATACASSARPPGTCASWSPAGCPASAPSPTRAAAPSAPAITVAATAASGPWRHPSRRPSCPR